MVGVNVGCALKLGMRAATGIQWAYIASNIVVLHWERILECDHAVATNAAVDASGNDYVSDVGGQRSGREKEEKEWERGGRERDLPNSAPTTRPSSALRRVWWSSTWNITICSQVMEINQRQ